MLRNPYKFSAAQNGEQIVFGAARPGYSPQAIYAWIAFMKSQGIQNVCCLLSESQLLLYPQLLEIYHREFGVQKVVWVPIEDFQLCELDHLIQKILPFLQKAKTKGERVVVHCSGGIGRTGHILAAWLVSDQGLSNQAAIKAVRQTGRNPYEFAMAAILKGKNPFKIAKELDHLLNACRGISRE